MSEKKPNDKPREGFEYSIPDDPGMRGLLALGPEEMTLRDAALYSAGYVDGYAAATEEDAR